MRQTHPELPLAFNYSSSFKWSSDPNPFTFRELGELETTLAEFTSISPSVIVSPFRSEAQSVANLTPDITAFFAPGVLVLLLQHIAVTFGALSVVRERQIGTVELFRVAPISPGEVLVGKYLSYLIFGGLLAAVLTLLLRYALGVPMLGNWWHYVLVIGLILLASLGIGLVHIMPLDRGEVIVRIPLRAGGTVAFRTQIVWCRNFGDGWYASGGRFLDVVSPPPTEPSSN